MLDNPSPQPLNYEPRPPAVARPAWVYVVLAFYLALLLALVAAAVIFSFNLNSDHRWPTALIALAVTIVPFALGGGLLVLVPVRARRGRNITRRSIWFPLLGAGILLAILGVGGALATIEYLNAHTAADNSLAHQIYLIVGLIWLFWMLVFGLVSRSADSVSLSGHLYKFLLAGSVVELLVAVPMHLVVRRRTECCAGIYTGTAICLGVVTAIVALGPGVFFLYYRRWREMYSKGRNSDGSGSHEFHNDPAGQGE